MNRSGVVNDRYLICPTCKIKLGSGANFCGSCGATGVRDTEVALSNLKSAWGYLIRGKRWTDKWATKHPVLTGLATVLTLLFLFSFYQYVGDTPYIGGLLAVPPILLMIPFGYALISATREIIRLEVEKSNKRRQQWLAQRQREEDERRRLEEERRQAILAYQRWFDSLSPEEQQVELMKQHMRRQEQQMQDLMEQNQQIADKKEKNDAIAAWAIMHTVRHHK